MCTKVHWVDSADNKVMIFLLTFFSKKTGFGIACKLSPKDNLHKMSNLVFWGKK